MADLPAARRALSLALHVAAASLLYLIILRLEPRAGRAVAGVLAATWFFHPVHADSVLAVSGRSAVLSGLLLLAALFAASSRRTWCAACLFGCAVAARETALAGLLPLLALAVAPLAAPQEIARWRFAPFAIVGAAAAACGIATPRYRELAEYSFLARPFLESVVSQVSAVPVGLWLLVRPASLSIDYGIPLPVDPSAPLFLFGLVCYALAAVGSLALRKRAPAASVGLALWLAALLPTQSLIPKLDALTNRPLALALAGLLLALAPLASAIARRLPRLRAPAAAVAALLVLGALGASTARRSALFRSELALWGDAAAKSISNARPHLQYAMLLRRARRDREALAELSIAREIDPFSSRMDALSAEFQNLREEPR